MEKKTLEESFWTDNKNNSSVLREMSNIKSKIEKYNNLKSEFDNLKDLSDLLKVESDDELARELIKNTAKWKDWRNKQKNQRKRHLQFFIQSVCRIGSRC